MIRKIKLWNWQIYLTYSLEETTAFVLAHKWEIESMEKIQG